MKNVQVTCYERFNRYLGNHELVKLLEGIRSGRWKRPVTDLRDALARKDMQQAETIKKSLPAFTLSACYEGARRAENLRQYNSIVILDIDKLDADHVDPVVWKASDSLYTLFAFRSPGGRGVKIGVNPVAPGVPPLTAYVMTAENHRDTFRAAKAYYETLLGVAVDPSGKDPGRLCFVSYDPYIFVAPAERWEQGIVRAEAPEIPDGPEADKEPLPFAAEEEVDIHNMSPDDLSALFRKLRKKTSRTIKYSQGNRNNYVFRFAVLCQEEEVPADDTMGYCRKSFGDLSETELQTTVQSAYNRTADENEKRNKKMNIIDRIQEELAQRYRFRYNLVMDCVEFRRRRSSRPFRMLEKKMENTMWCELQRKGINCQLKTMRAVLLSDFVPDYHPFREYFGNLPKWDGQTDHIRRVADLVQTTNPGWWHECFRRWIVALVACATRPGVENHTVLMLDGEQGTGKTRWCCNLVPPELHDYRHSGPANPRSKDIRIGMSQCLLINLDELHALDEKELNQMKEMITTGVIRERVPYGERAGQYERVCSYTASIDSSQVLTDINGSRRFLCFRVRSIDYMTPIDYTGLYSQAVALLKNDFKYWFDRSDIELLNRNNEEFRIHSPEEEFFNTFFRKPRREDTNISYLSVAQILQVMCLKTFLKVTPRGTQLLSSILKKNGFRQVRHHNRRLYAVIIRSDDEVKAEKENPHTPDQQGDLPLTE